MSRDRNHIDVDLVAEFLVPWSIDFTEEDGNRSYAVYGFVQELIGKGYETDKIHNASTVAACIVNYLCDNHEISIFGLKND